MGFDMSKALGAAHALEIPFVFGDFDGGIAALGPFFGNSPGKAALSRSMMSYWGQFARTGDPGTGSDGNQVPWAPWGVNGDRSIVLDTLEDAGIRMTSEEVTVAGIKAQLESDPGIIDPKERCSLYVRTFRSGGFDEQEYRNFGPEGCGAYDPAEFPGGF